jgi:hypothetical protein
LPSPDKPGRYQITAILQYRKVDQFLLNYLFGEQNQLTSPVTEIGRATTTVKVNDQPQASVNSPVSKPLAAAAVSPLR